MNIIKLSAINSTNDYLKQLVATCYVENLTVVVTENQTSGRGQMGAKWNAEPSKNLTFSILVKDLLLQANHIFNLNVAIAVSIMQALDDFTIPGICIKWPNDILAGNKKVGGVLIENSFKNDGEIYSVIGIGLNVNQMNFDNLPKASSLAATANREFEKDEVMTAIIKNIIRNANKLLNKDVKPLWDAYHSRLFKKDVPMPFESDGKQFMGIIKGVSQNGSLEVLLEDETIATYGIKEVQMLY
jgi:BirA family biotin operon repressor/biotin-[acetyl-CoA-carboxylase] ligase